MMDPFMPSYNVNSYAPDDIFDPPAGGPGLGQLGHIDDWIFDLLQQEI